MRGVSRRDDVPSIEIVSSEALKILKEYREEYLVLDSKVKQEGLQ